MVPEAVVRKIKRGGNPSRFAEPILGAPGRSYRSQWYVDAALGSMFAFGIHGQMLWCDPCTKVCVVQQSSNHNAVPDCVPLMFGAMKAWTCRAEPQIVTGGTWQQADHSTLVRQLTALVASTQLPCLQVDRTPLQSDGIARRINESTAAVVGLSALFPSGASSARMASRLVVCSHDAIIEVPLARWDVNDRSDLSEPAASRVRHYGLVRNAELVDNAAFAVSPAETLAMDPQQRLLLEHGYAALHNAALAREQLIPICQGA